MTFVESAGRRIAVLTLLLAASACGHLDLPPPEGVSLSERRRALGEDASAGVTVIPKKAPGEISVPAEDAETGTAVAASVTTEQSNAKNAAAEETAKSSSVTSMSEAKKLEAPDLGIRLPIGDPVLKPRQRTTSE